MASRPTGQFPSTPSFDQNQEYWCDTVVKLFAAKTAQWVLALALDRRIEFALGGRQAVAFMSSFREAPPERFSRSRTLAVLLPWRAPVAFLGDWADFAPLLAFFAGVALLPDLALDGATWAFCAADRDFWAGGGCSAGAPASVLAVSAGMPFIVRSPWR